MRESLCDHFSDSSAFIFTKEFITELNDVITEGVLDDFVDAEGDFVDEFLFGFRGELLDFLWRMISFQLWDKFHHVFDDTHGIFVQSKIEEVLLSEFKERVGMHDGEQSDDFLDEMGGIGMATELEEVFLDTFAHELIFFIIGKELDKCLNGMGTLLVPDNIGDILVESLHDFQSLSIITDAEQFLNHVVCIFMGDKVR